MDQETKKEFENLARMMKIGFDNTASKNDIEDLEKKVDKRFEDVNNQFEDVSRRLKETELNLKDHTEEKLSDLKGDLVVLMRKEDKKVNALIEILNKNNILKDEDVNKLMQLEPFARGQI